MPVAVSYPGVHVQETSGGVRSFPGVATSITALLGRALRGPVDEPVAITGFADFERIFGGLWVESALGFSVRDFFMNGGSRAIIVRMYQAPVAGARRQALIEAGTLRLQARDPGVWGNALQVQIEDDAFSDDAFSLSVRDNATGQLEIFRGVSVVPGHPRQGDRVLLNESRLSVAAGALPDAKPAATICPVLENGKAVPEGLLSDASFIGAASIAEKRGLHALDQADLFNILCIPPYIARGDDMLGGDVDKEVVAAAASYCEGRRAMLLVDAPSAWDDAAAAAVGVKGVGTASRNAALFFPRLMEAIAERGGQVSAMAPCGAIAGILARTDVNRGVWEAPAGIDTALNGVEGLSVAVSDAENRLLNPLGINCLRAMNAAGRIVWGARTLQGDDLLGSEWKYIPVRRTALYIEESVYRGTQWAVFEPNDEPLWAQIRLNVGAFLHDMFRQGAFQGMTPSEAYFIKCDRETTTGEDSNRGIVNITVGFAPLKPAEFVVITIQRIAGQGTSA
ncbi:MAG: phage tail sheath subtilisin-like domain-containing protein [Telluria sp.]|nr:phage tail sheath subtilisin-like domain-containing protein [Telluria sp.]